MKAAQLLGLCTVIFIVMSLQVSAQPDFPTETTAVGRVVGDTPSEMQRQLEIDRLELKHATYFLFMPKNPFDDGHSKKTAIIEAQFPFEHVTNNHHWYWSEVYPSVEGFKQQEYFVVESREGKEAHPVLPAEVLAELSLQEVRAKNWKSKFAETTPLFVFSTDYGGLYIPEVESFMSELGQDAVTVTTNAFSSDQFVMSFICNLGRADTIGNAFKNARNEYYSGVFRKEFLLASYGDERPGLTLFSYLLYGNPLAKVALPDKGEDRLEEHCKQYLKAQQEPVASQFVATQAIGSQLSYEGEFVFEVSSWSLKGQEGYSIISADNLKQDYAEFELVLPYQVLKHEFPLKTVVENISLVSLEAPVDLSVSNLPSWENGLVDRLCYYEMRNASIDFSYTFTENKEVVLVEVNPVEVVDCEKGEFKLYTKIVYSLDYVPYSPVLIKQVNVPVEATPRQELTAVVVLENIEGSSFEGELVLSTESEIVAEKSIAFSGEQELSVVVPFKAGSKTGITGYKLEFVQDGDSKTFYEFSINVKSIELSLEVPQTVRETGELSLAVNNLLSSPVEAAVNSYVMKEEIVVDKKEVTLQPGFNTVKISYSGLEREAQTYELLATLHYGNEKESVTATLVSNHPPTLKVRDVTVTEGEMVSLDTDAKDVDGDAVEVTYSGDMESSEWQTRKGDAGVYEVVVTASDGLLSASQSVSVTVIAKADYDGDGYEDGVDCNDNDELINPGAAEACDEVDNNCDGIIDEDICQFPEACQSFFSRMKASYLSSCGSAKYDYAADINGDKIINALDFSILAAHVTDSAWCSDAIAAASNPC